MNSLDYSLRDLKVLEYINKHENCTMKELMANLDSSAFDTARTLAKDKLIEMRGNDNQLIILIRGMELLEDRKLYLRSRKKEKVFNILVQTIAPLAGVIVGYFLPHL